MKTLIFVLIAISLYLIVRHFQKKNVNANPSNNNKGEKDADKIVENLENLGYFKYTDQKDIEEVKKKVKDGFAKYSDLISIYEDNKPYNAKDFRNYPLDGEDLYEEGGIVEKLEEMQLTFDKMNVKMEITHHIEEWDDKNQWLNHEITINGKEYIIFKNFSGIGWGEAALRFAEIVNDQLEIQGSNERLFLVNGGNEGRAIFLTEEQFILLDPILQGTHERPLRIDDWCKAMQVQHI